MVKKYFIGSDSILDILPGELIIDKVTPELWQYDLTNCEFFEGTNRLKKTFLGGYYSSYPHDCIIFLESKDAVDKEYYIEGLGFYYFWLIPYSNSEYTAPVYYKKGEEAWGIPYEFDCDTLFTIVGQYKKQKSQLFISPNPISESAKITIEQNIDEVNSFYFSMLWV